MVVVFGAREAEVRRRVDLVELAHGLDRAQLRQIEPARPEAFLAPHPALQVLDEIPLIQHVARPLERAHALADLDDRRHRRAPPISAGGACSPYSPASFSARLPPSE